MIIFSSKNYSIRSRTLIQINSNQENKNQFNNAAMSRYIFLPERIPVKRTNWTALNSYLMIRNFRISILKFRKLLVNFFSICSRSVNKYRCICESIMQMRSKTQFSIHQYNRKPPPFSRTREAVSSSSKQLPEQVNPPILAIIYVSFIAQSDIITQNPNQC